MAVSAFQRMFSKSVWFALFNVGTVIYLVASGTLQWNWISVLSCSVSLLLIDGIALYSSRNFPDWKWTRKQQQDWDQKGASPVNQSSPESKE
jgi:hypothetical protein